MLADSGALLAMLDENDVYHERCKVLLGLVPVTSLNTTWLCFTEVIYFLGEAGGYYMQSRLWKLRREGLLVVLELTDQEADYMDAAMEKYKDVPMDAADASLMAVAQFRGIRKLLTFDSDFYVYRFDDGSVMDVIQ